MRHIVVGLAIWTIATPAFTGQTIAGSPQADPRARSSQVVGIADVHVDYHRVSDEARFINYGGEERILRAAYGLIRAVADAAERPAFQRAEGASMPASMGKLMRQPSRSNLLSCMGAKSTTMQQRCHPLATLSDPSLCSRR